jgi:hypothetical protein
LNDITLEPTDIEHSDAVVRQLVDMGSQTISGFTTISDFTLELLYLCVSPSAGIIAEPLFPIITTPKIIIEKGNEIKLEPFDYERLNNPISIPKITKSAGYPDFIQENSIKDAMSEIESARNKIKQVISAFGDLQDRVAVLVQENKRQATLLNSKSSISLDSLKSRIKRIRKVQDGQIAKASSLLEVLFDMTQPRLSSQEIQWFQDLSVMLNVYNTKFVPELKQVYFDLLDSN